MNDSTPHSNLIIYYRPGCPFAAKLRANLSLPGCPIAP